MRLSGDDKYWKEEMKYNESFGEILDFALKTILNKKIKQIRFGNECQFMKYTGEIKAKLLHRKQNNGNDKSLVLKGKDFELQCLLNYWDEIAIRNKGIDIEEVGIYIDFQNPILEEYNKVKKNLIEVYKDV